MRATVGDGVAVLALARPAVLNAIDTATCRALVAEIDRLEEAGEASVLVLTGGGCRAFCAGADLRHMRMLPPEALRRFIELTWTSFDRIARSPMISIAAVDGYALGGGAELALACDFRVASETAAFGFPEMTLGSVPGSGAMQRLPGLIGPSRALDLVTSGRRVGGPEAVALGLADRIAASGEADAVALAWAGEIARRPREALRYAKTAIRLGPRAEIAPGLHGLISAVCQRADEYRATTERFAASALLGAEGEE